MWLARTISRKLGLLPVPNHIDDLPKKRVPVLGGAAVFFPYGILLAVLTHLQVWVVILIGSLWAVVILGTIDDFYPLTWWVKLCFEVIVISISLPLLLRFMNITATHWGLVIMGIVLVVLITNGFNLIDVSDGLASSVGGVISFGLVMIFVFGSGKPEWGLAPLLLIGFLGGFLVFNHPPATIYLGDGGSLPLGMFLGIFLVLWTFSSGIDVRSIVIFTITASPVFFEIILVSYHRLKKGISPLHGSSDHFALRLLRSGWSEAKVLMASVIFCLILIGCVSLIWLPGWVAVVYAGTVLVLYGASFIVLSKIKVEG